jgi:hypothetical protein
VAEQDKVVTLRPAVVGGNKENIDGRGREGKDWTGRNMSLFITI